MAFLIKNANVPRLAGAVGNGQALISQWIHVSTAARALPQTSTDQIFQVFGGRVLVHLLVGEVTTVIQGTDPVLKVTAAKLDAPMAAVVGTAVDVASTTDISSLEVGGSVNILGSGAAIVKNNAGALLSTLGRVEWVAPRGEIYITTGASKTGALKWDIFYQPLDEGAFVKSVVAATVAI